MQERMALAFEDGTSDLGPVAHRLLRSGIDVLYARSVDEAFLLASQEATRIHALLVAPDVEPAAVVRVSRAVESAAGEPRQIQSVVIGAEAGEQTRKALREAGVSWAVWDPEDDSALRFVVSAALTLPSEIVPRNEPRVPTSLMASIRSNDERRDALIYTLSARGAFLEVPRPLPVGTKLELEIWFASRIVKTSAEVIYVNAPDASRRHCWPLGMAIVFDALSEKDESSVRRFIEEQSARISV
jgi:hypothetical protein